MTRTNEVLRTMNDDGFTVKAMSLATKKSIPQIYRYLDMENPIQPPIEFLNQLYCVSRDPRLVELITYGVPVTVQPMDIRHPVIDTPEILKENIEQRRKDLDCEAYVLAILADGRIDHSDAQAVENYKKAFWESLKHAMVIYQTISAKFDHATGAPK